jgi:alpha-1,2-mannosyltransferase
MDSPDSTRTLLLRKDFASFYYACKAARLDKNMYDTRTLNDLAAADMVRNYVFPYLYPPFFAVVAQGASSLSPQTAQDLWDCLQILAVGLTIVLVFLSVSPGSAGPSLDIAIAAVLCAVALFVLPFSGNLDYGQMNVFVVFWLAACFYLSFRWEWDQAAGVALAFAVLLKVTPALFVLFFLLGGRVKVLWGFFGGMFVLILTALLVQDVGPWLQFAKFLPDAGYGKTVSGGFLPGVVTNFSLAGFFMRVFVVRDTPMMLATMVAILALLVTLSHHHLKKGTDNPETLVLPYSVFVVIASPVAWMLHLIYLFPGILLSLSSLWNSGRRSSFAVMSIACAFAVFDFPSMYARVSIPEELRPYVTSMNLVFLLVLFFMSLYMRKEDQSALSGDEEDET